MIALDTNALVRMLIEDDENQALAVKRLMEAIEKKEDRIIILSEVFIETVGVLESVYEAIWKDIYRFLEALMYTSVFTFSEPQVIRNAIHHYKKGGDFADLIIVIQARNHQAKKSSVLTKSFKRDSLTT